LHVLCDILVPLSLVIALLLLISSITTVHESPRGAWLDSRPAFLRTPHFRLFILSSTDLSVKSGNIGAWAWKQCGINAKTMWVVSDGGDWGYHGLHNHSTHAGGPNYRPKCVNVPPSPLSGYLHVLCDILVPLSLVIALLLLIYINNY